MGYNDKTDRLENDFVYQMTSTIAKLMDKRYLDPLLGFIFPAFGDTLMSVLILPYLYISIFRIKSLSLTLAIVLNALIDILVGIIPYGIGDIFDIFHRSYAKNLRLIEGFVKHDEGIIREVNRKAWISGIMIVVTCVVIYFMLKLAFVLISNSFDFITSLFA